MKKYDQIIMLSPGIRENENGSRKFQKDEENFSYETAGDPYEFRFKAVRKLFLSGACSNFILVGGQVETITNNVKSKFVGLDGGTISKSEVICDSLVNNYGIPIENLTILESSSNTKGNAEAVLKYLKEQNINVFDNIGLLTSFWHLPRSLKIFKDASLSLVPISAESIIYDEDFVLIQDFYKEEGFSRILANVKDHDSEIKGMSDKENGSYVPRFK